MNEIERLDKLLQKADSVLETHTPNPPGVLGFPTLSTQAFTAWKTQCLNYLESILPSSSNYIKDFKETVKNGYVGHVNAGKGILESVKEDINEGIIELSQTDISKESPVDNISNLIEKFHIIARQIRNRYNSRETLDINDEYDVQDLFNALLYIYFEDIRKEEWTPSYAGQCARMDFLIKDCDVVIEIKKTRKGLSDKEVGNQLIEDIERYKIHPNCSTLICFVYDPEGRISNPRGIENDLSKKHDDLDVIVLIRP